MDNLYFHLNSTQLKLLDEVLKYYHLALFFSSFLSWPTPIYTERFSFLSFSLVQERLKKQVSGSISYYFRLWFVYGRIKKEIRVLWWFWWSVMGWEICFNFGGKYGHNALEVENKKFNFDPWFMKISINP